MFQLVKIAKLDISGNAFKSAPAAVRFIKRFKADWTLQREQDATAFVVTFSDNFWLTPMSLKMQKISTIDQSGLHFTTWSIIYVSMQTKGH